MKTQYTKQDSKGRLKLAPGYFSPSRLKTLEACPWQYELKYHQKIYPDQPIIEPHSQLGSAMHEFAENYDGKKDKRLVDLLRHRCLKNYTLDAKQIVELDFMIHNLVEHVWPEMEGKGPEPFEITSVQKEANIKGDVVVPGPEGSLRVLPLNMKIDRVIKRADGRVVIVDYKKGQPNVASHMFQLVFYVRYYSQKYRVPVDNIDIWLVFPNEDKNWIKKVKGEELSEHLSSFEEDMSSKIQKIEVEAPFNESHACVSFLCNFCPYQATEFCPTSLMTHGATNPENKHRTFSITSYENGKKVSTPVNPSDVLSADAW